MDANHDIVVERGYVRGLSGLTSTMRLMHMLALLATIEFLKGLEVRGRVPLF